MNITKAIDIVNTHKCDMHRNQVPELIDALELLIEAGKRELEYRLPRFKGHIKLLPGETPEVELLPRTIDGVTTLSLRHTH